ncbi:LysR substrate-binding domain-containing protein [Actinophytocola sediminis]
MTSQDPPPTFRLAYVPGVTPGKWAGVWRTRLPDVPIVLDQVAAADAVGVVRERGADAALLRLPIDRTGLSAIPLYTETTVLVLPKDHELAEAAEVAEADLADTVLLHPQDDPLDWEGPPGVAAHHRPATTTDAVELVAAGVGLLVVPQSIARLHHRRDLTYRPVDFAPESRVALTWLADETTDLMEQFIGIVRGRTVNSTRGRPPTQQKPPAPAPRKAATSRSSGGHRGRDGRRGRPRHR